MSLPIISADQRLAEPRGIKGCIFGKSGIGKTSLLWTLNASTTLFMDLEAGDLAIEGWARRQHPAADLDGMPGLRGVHRRARTRRCATSRLIARRTTRLSATASAIRPHSTRYDTIFVDSITVAGRLCFQWAKGQPEALFREDRQAGRARRLRAARPRDDRLADPPPAHAGKNVWFVGILDEKLDDFNRKLFQPQIDGSKTGLELPGIVDEVITMAELKDEAAIRIAPSSATRSTPGATRPRIARAGSTKSRSPISAADGEDPQRPQPRRPRLTYAPPPADPAGADAPIPTAILI
jgi:hypothetical protein